MKNSLSFLSLFGLTQGGASEDAQLLQTYESQHGAQRDLIEAQERQLGILVRQLQESNAAKVTYQQAFDRLSKVFKEKEAKNVRLSLSFCEEAGGISLLLYSASKIASRQSASFHT